MWETKVGNAKPYAKPFYFRVVELQATFTAPSGKDYRFYGFYDGDGFGADAGNIWKIRFPPNELGTWRYRYAWTDGTPGGDGRFDVVDTGLRGPLKEAREHGKYFENARGEPVHVRAYSMHQYLEGKYGRGVFSDEGVTDLIQKINTKVGDRRYNFLMLMWPVVIKVARNHFWQDKPATFGLSLADRNTADFSRFHIPVWKRIEKVLANAARRQIYVLQFVALVDQYSSRPDDEQLIVYLRYMAARLGPYWNNLGYSAVWEYQDIWSSAHANSVMSRLHKNLSGLPHPPLLTIHDHSSDLFSGWLGFSMRQQQSRTVFKGNCRACGKHGGVGSRFLNKPIIGSEDIWEYHGDPRYGQPKNGAEVRRGAWGIMMAGVMPVYSEVGLTDAKAPAGGRSNFSGEGESEIRRMFDFFYFKTRYRSYQMLNQLVSTRDRQICSGVPGQEYLVYDEDGGSITIDLTALPSSVTLSLLWFDPKTGQEQNGAIITGGMRRTALSPYPGDTVMLLRRISS
jgi:hypothetical protein